MAGRYKTLLRRMEEIRPKLFRTAFAWSRDRALAEDLAQETLVRGLVKIEQLRAIDALEGWLFRIMVNVWRDHVRRDHPADPVDDVDVRIEESPELLSSQRETIHRVRNALHELPENFRVVLTLVDIEGFTYAETAKILDVPVGTIMSRLSRGRKQLKHLLEGGETSGHGARKPRVWQVK